MASRSKYARQDALTQREREVLALIANGMTNDEIALALTISKRTADNHVHNILAKLKVRSRTQAAILAVQEGLLTQDRDFYS